MADPAFWNAQERAREVVQEVKQLKGWLDPFDKLVGRIRSAVELVELLSLEPDAEMEAEVEREATAIRDDVEAFELRSLLQGRDDFRDAQLEISAGAGGTEAQDWAQMLMRMYTRWAERKGFGVDIIDLSEGEEAGIKGAVLEIKGEYAYGFLRPESGVHRLVRISPFDSQARRHTSFASVFVYPVVNEEINIEIREEDLRIDVYRASGAGGQHVNKTSSAVRITHIPTGIVMRVAGRAFAVQEQGDGDEAAQEQALPAWRWTSSLAVKAAMDANKQDVSFGSQIRSYVFQPYTMVNDHRTELKLTDVHKVMDGAIDPFIQEYLKQNGALAPARPA
jgi:peptide chain release factor 2